MVTLFILVVLWMSPSIVAVFENQHFSSEHLKDVLDRGVAFLETLNVEKDVKTNQSNKMRNLKAHIEKVTEDVKYFQSLYKDSPAGFVFHPVNAFKVVLDFIHLRHYLLDADYKSYNDINRHLPTMHVHHGTIEAIVRLQETYDLEAADFASGVIYGQKARPLDFSECLLIGRHIYKKMKKYKLASSWFSEVLKYPLSVAEKEKYLPEVYKMKVQSEMKAKLFKKASRTLKSWISNFEKIEEPLELKKTLKKEKEKEKGKPKEVVKPDPVSENYRKLCKGEYAKPTVEENVTLSCRFYDNNRHPLLILQPARQEDVRMNPYIVIYRDVFTQPFLEKLKQHSKKLLTDSGVGDSTVPNNVRTSKGIFLEETDAIFQRIQKPTEAITGLDSSIYSYEELQVQNYGLGGHYLNHKDYFPDSSYNRVATFMVYMTDVEAGGNTIFTWLDVKVKPTAGTALYWHNLRPGGAGNPLTLHAACPVVLGEKWVFTQWIYGVSRYFYPFKTSDSI